MEICKICNRSFSNRKALGGHIRSHFLKHPLPPKNDNVPSQPLRVVSHKSVSSRSESTCPISQQKLGAKMASLPTRRRSERRRKDAPVPFSGNISDEEAALLLIQLSSGTWNTKPKEEEEEEEEEEEGTNIDNNNNKNNCVLSIDDAVNVKKRGYYKCKYCDKVFKSGQALGGHKKAHFSTTIIPKNITTGTLYIDLNLPPLSDEHVRMFRHNPFP